MKYMGPSYSDNYMNNTDNGSVVFVEQNSEKKKRKRIILISCVLVLVLAIVSIAVVLNNNTKKTATVDGYINFLMNGDAKKAYDGPRYYKDNSNYISQALYDDDMDVVNVFNNAAKILEEASKNNSALDEETVKNQIEYLKIYNAYHGSIILNDKSIVETYMQGGAEAVNASFVAPINDIDKFRNQDTNSFVTNASGYINTTLSMLELFVENGCDVANLGNNNCAVSPDRKQELLSMASKRTVYLGETKSVVFSSVEHFINEAFTLGGGK